MAIMMKRVFSIWFGRPVFWEGLFLRLVEDEMGQNFELGPGRYLEFI